MDISDKVDFYYKIAIISWKRYNYSSLQQVVKDSLFYSNNRGNINRGFSRLFRNNMWKLHGLLESMVLNRGTQFAAELTKELNRMLEIETKLSKSFYLQIDNIIT